MTRREAVELIDRIRAERKRLWAEVEAPFLEMRSCGLGVCEKELPLHAAVARAISQPEKERTAGELVAFQAERKEAYAAAVNQVETLYIAEVRLKQLFGLVSGRPALPGLIRQPTDEEG